MVVADRELWRAGGEEKRDGVRRMFGEIAQRYDLLNSILSLRLHHRWRARAVHTLRLKPGDSALDVCCGTGDFLIPLAKAVGLRGCHAEERSISARGDA